MENESNLQPNVNKKKSIKKNYFYNLIYQVVALITPLITTPYVSRVLNSDGVGRYSFTFSIASYFILFGAFGFAYYAQREIAKHQGDKYVQSKLFWEILIARFITVGISVIVYIALILFNIYGDYTILMYILLIQVAGTAFDVSFLFQGNEEFGVITLRNVIIKIIGIVCIIVFVRTKDDVWVYTLCQSMILIVSNLSLWVSLPKRLVKVSVKEFNVKKHFIPTLRLFVPTIAVSVYTMLDKTLIGLMVEGCTDVIDEAGKVTSLKISEIENGYYEQSEKIVKIVLTVITALGTVMIPRNAKELADGNYSTFIDNIKKSIRAVFLIGMPLMLGLIAVAQNFSPWFFGDGFEKVPYLIMIFSALVMFIGLSNVLAIQYLIPLQADNRYTIAVVVGAITNLVLNLILIKPMMSYGAAIASIISEFIVMLVCIIFAKKDFSFKEILKNIYKYIIASLLMFGAVFATQYFISSSILNTILLVLEGAAIYGVSLILMRDEFVMVNIKKVIRRFKKSE